MAKRQQHEMTLHLLFPSDPLQMSLTFCNFLSSGAVFIQVFLDKTSFNSNCAICLEPLPLTLEKKEWRKHLKQKSVKGDSDKKKISPWNQPINHRPSFLPLCECCHSCKSLTPCTPTINFPCHVPDRLLCLQDQYM